jgi:anti-anti-sigma factor
MTNNAPSLLVALVDHHAAIVKIKGRANFTTSVTFKRLVTELQERGFESFVLDLSECVTMDSTFLGVLAGAALKLSHSDHAVANARGQPGASRVRLFNPNPRVSDLLDNLGVSDLFGTVRCQPRSVEEFQTPSEEAQPSREEISRTCLEAHQLLMDLNPENVSKFKDVTQFLAEDLKKFTTERAETQPSEACASHGNPEH